MNTYLKVMGSMGAVVGSSYGCWYGVSASKNIRPTDTGFMITCGYICGAVGFIIGSSVGVTAPISVPVLIYMVNKDII